MAYCSLDDLKKKIDEATLVQLTDTTGAGVVDTAKTDRAIRDADAMINAYAGKVYKVPINPVPYVIADTSATLAIVNLHRFRSVDTPVWSAEQGRAMEFLKNVADGAVTVEGAIPQPAPADDISDTAGFTTAQRLFSRDLMKDM